MDHPLENLGPERFQQLCQALFVKEYPGVVCLPVGQPDGGRDALQHAFDKQEQRFTVIQVKFSKHQLLERDKREWVLASATNEIDKVNALKAKGAERYVFVTNVQGTSHLDVGSVDRLQADLSTTLNIPVLCWWRDDINRRLDSSWDLKLRYPEVLSGQDFLRLLSVSTQGDQHERRHSAIKAFLANQYEEDQDVKFKQVQLQNKLLDLFVDLPFRIHLPRPPQSGSFPAAHMMQLRYLPNADGQSLVIEDASDDHDEAGTASLLLNETTEDWLNQVIVEGAPGQGKSTLAQYVCQVHRIRLLGKTHDDAALPNSHRVAPVSLPFKVDLRDLSEWLTGKDPFVSNPTHPAPDEDLTLETFLARLVRHKSGGSQFAAADLLALSRHTPILLALDGLDEVADIKRRAEVVGAVSKALPRLRENCRALRVIITSRPAAFANSPGFDQKHYPYLTLKSVKRSQIHKYAGRWMAVRHFDEKEKVEFTKILDEKLDQPHLRDLSRNPMQLTILLSLIHTRGSALPDKRTKLYDDYVDLFFSRESTKNPVVREHLELLKDIHRYLAWVLHTAAEQGKGSAAAGRLTTQHFKKVLSEYLEKERQDTAIIEDIFRVMLERVVMIVSRLEGTYEFEVQPLREYFAARYLYDTAPYSPPGGEQAGTKPDRFDAIARNFYWFNVVRFFCGCFSKGELFDLADRIKQFIAQEPLGVTRHPVLLGATLLADWVFTQSPRAMEQVASALSTRAALRRLLPIDLYKRDEPIRIPASCGGPSVCKSAMDALFDGTTKYDVRRQIAVFVNANMRIDERLERWIAEAPVDDSGVGWWLALGRDLECLFDVDEDILRAILKPRTLTSHAVSTIWHSGRINVLDSNPTYDAYLSDAAFMTPQYDGQRGGDDLPFYLIPRVLGYLGSGYALHGPPSDRKDFLEALQRAPESFTSASSASGYQHAISSACKAVSVGIAERANSTTFLLESVDFFEQVVSEIAAALGDLPAIVQAALAVARLPQGGRHRTRAAVSLNSEQPLSVRIRYAKAKSKHWDWWSACFAGASSELRRFLAWLTFCTFAPVTMIIEHSGELAILLREMSDVEWQRLVSFLGTIDMGFGRSRTGSRTNAKLNYQGPSERVAFVLASKDHNAFSNRMFMSHFVGFQDSSGIYAAYRQFNASDAAVHDRLPWSTAQEIIRSTYKQGASYGIFYASKLPDHVADAILADPDAYPFRYWDAAQTNAESKVKKSVRSVAQTAKRERWFSH